MRVFLFLLIGFFGVGVCDSARAESALPYFVSLRADTVNLRTGPSVRYPIKWIYERKNYPMEVTSSFQQWRKIRDVEGESGWVHESLLSRKRFVLVQGEGYSEVRRLPNPTAVVIAKAERGVMAELITCKDNWCRIQVGDIKGWMDSRVLWGVSAGESAE